MNQRNMIAAVAIALSSLAATGASGAEPAELPNSLVEAEAALRGDPTNLRLGAEFRQTAIAVEAYDHAIEVLEELVAAHPDNPDVRLNLGFAHVDKIPAAGAVSQAILSHAAIAEFGRALELEESWLGYYSRGGAYVYWPSVYQYASNAIADLERAVEITAGDPIEPYHVRHWIALGDAWWREGDLDKSREVWRRGLANHPDDRELAERLAAADDEALAALLDRRYELGHRIDTGLVELWEP